MGTFYLSRFFLYHKHKKIYLEKLISYSVLVICFNLNPNLRQQFSSYIINLLMPDLKYYLYQRQLLHALTPDTQRIERCMGHLIVFYVHNGSGRGISLRGPTKDFTKVTDVHLCSRHTEYVTQLQKNLYSLY